MKIIISPAKKMLAENHTFGSVTKPYFIEETKAILKTLQGKELIQLTKLWNCSPKLAEENYKKIKEIDLNDSSKQVPALFAYEGIQYQNMAPNAFSEQELDFANKHLRILSGFYGLLRPMDAVMPYRLEMQAKLNINSSKNLYEFWNGKLAKRLLEEDLNDYSNNTPLIINLASKEYSKAVMGHLNICQRQLSEHHNDKVKRVKVYTCIFGSLKDGKVIQKSTESKAARGTMVRYLCQVKDEGQVKDEEKTLDYLKEFDLMGFTFDEGRSTETIKAGKSEEMLEIIEKTLVFLK